MFGIKRRAAMKAALAEAQINAASEYARAKVRADAEITFERELSAPGLSEHDHAIISGKLALYRLGVEKAYGERYEMRDALNEQLELVRLGAAHFVSARNMSLISGSYAKVM